MTPAHLTGPTAELAPTLLGALLEVRWPGERAVTARLVEVEAYAGQGADPASHAHRGPRRANAALFGPPGRLYVYFTYGMHWCANVVCHPATPGAGGGVLLRAARLESGVEVARARAPRPGADRDLARGPARLARALGITGAADGVDLLGDPDSPVRLRPGRPPREVRSGPRVGVSTAAATPWRFWDPDAPEVSAYRPAVPRRRPRRAGDGASGRGEGGAGE
ncbi:MAG: DNA-3-methyladenine glycosylase [Kineosporiaceae bacterium]